MASPVFRFAPSPNGFLHLGHAYCALLNDALARRAGGRLLLRIEDIDPERCRPEYEAAMTEDLRWLGLRFEGPVRRQSEHMADYAAALAELEKRGVTYPAFLGRGELLAMVAVAEQEGRHWPRDPDGAPHYPAAERNVSAAEAVRRIAAGDAYAVRLDMAAALDLTGPLDWEEAGAGRPEADPASWGDVVLARKDVPTSYHLAVVVDDALQGVTDIVRGADLRAATAVHRVLQTLLGVPAPRYRHHRLVIDSSGRKLAKSDHDTGLAELRAAGASPDDIRRMVGLQADLATLVS